MRFLFSYQKTQNQEDFDNHDPLLMRNRSYCECDDDHCEERNIQASENDETIIDILESQLDIMLCSDLASCAAEMELEREEDGSQ